MSSWMAVRSAAQYASPLNSLHDEVSIHLLRHRPDVPRPEDARVEVDEKILEPRFVDVRLVEVGLVCLLEGSSCGCAP